MYTVLPTHTEWQVKFKLSRANRNTQSTHEFLTDSGMMASVRMRKTVTVRHNDTRQVVYTDKPYNPGLWSEHYRSSTDIHTTRTKQFSWQLRSEALLSGCILQHSLMTNQQQGRLVSSILTISAGTQHTKHIEWKPHTDWNVIRDQVLFSYKLHLRKLFFLAFCLNRLTHSVSVSLIIIHQ